MPSQDLASRDAESGVSGHPKVLLFCPYPRRPKKATAGTDHLHAKPAGRAGSPVCQDSVPGRVCPWGGGSEDQPAWVQGSGGMSWSLGSRAEGRGRGHRGRAEVMQCPVNLSSPLFHWLPLLHAYPFSFYSISPAPDPSFSIPTKNTLCSLYLEDTFPTPCSSLCLSTNLVTLPVNETYTALGIRSCSFFLPSQLCYSTSLCSIGSPIAFITF